MTFNTDSNLFSIIGYGTFITQGYWKDKPNVQVCLIKNFTRIFPKNSCFPYVLPSNNSFWALKFDVNEQELKQLDKYEGVSLGLFWREKTEIIFKNGKKSTAFIYIPTKNSIISKNLTLESDKEDRWKEQIKKYPEILVQFPELMF